MKANKSAQKMVSDDIVVQWDDFEPLGDGSTDHSFDSVTFRPARGANIYGHSIVFREHELECVHCGEVEKMPDLVINSSPFRQAVYRLVLAAEFRDMHCDKSEFSGSIDLGNNSTSTGGLIWDVNKKQIQENVRRTVEQEMMDGYARLYR